VAPAAEQAPRDPFRERVAVVTGGGGGIGLALAQAFAARGAALVLADVDEEALARAERALAGRGAAVLAVPTDVTRRESVEALAERAFGRFGAVHLLCNNAGIAVSGPLVGADPGDWQAAMAINFWGVVHGVDAFVPRMLAHGQGGHVVNTASMAGLVGMDGLGIYCATKFAVVGLSESLYRELAPRGIGVSLLCPMLVATAIAENSLRLRGLTRPLAPPAPAAPIALQGSVIAPDEVARRVVQAIEARRFYVFTHPEQRELLRRRARRQDEVFESGWEQGGPR
jgi:NAD(P)-dependent dehydrogenase (short-subunit alcohol dehydrogenase family)